MTTSGLILVGEGFSPWTEKARWALDHHRIPYRYEEYTPLLSEPWLRLRARRTRGAISVPYLLGPGGFSLGDSFAIAQEADRRGREECLVPLDLMPDITAWNERAERLMRAGRSRILEQTEQRKDVQLESLPQELPRGIRRVLTPTVRVGTAYLRKKYAVRVVPDEELEVELAAVRAAIAGDPSRALLGRFTLADIAMASALQAVRPHATQPVGLLSAQRAAWERRELAARWEDVLAWRDAMVTKRPSPVAAP
ncbi:hypothetical protein AKJ09_09942 [Labilithrix luteola]|uniref:GST N-terminal domain-containing protein n=1 Tax=Labilithrix luteola TaxID=1391654 RepID=A0A0K1QC10_9BACT|nr:glutathione S-transferase N-terminal domain-containing protein [Labilithrix luteola]AKV03279.1 hypothetical protein AKJ09_09942 [Labilithrix luteola]